MKQAADASGRRICFVGMSLNHYLEAAHKDGRAPIDPRDVLQPNEIEDYDPNKVGPHALETPEDVSISSEAAQYLGTPISDPTNSTYIRQKYILSLAGSHCHHRVSG